MVAASYVKHYNFPLDLLNGEHDFTNGTYKMAATNTLPDVAADFTFDDITEISSGNGYPAGGITLTISDVSQTSGTAKATITDDTIDASGGSIGPFRYLVLYREVTESPGVTNPIVGHYDYGSAKTISNGESFPIDFSDVNGALTIA